jgi:hypothetical protein
MATKTFTQWVQFQKMIEPKLTKAVENASIRLCSKLKDIIEEKYYNLYDPLVYQRTYQFLNSAMQRLISHKSAEIYMDANAMDYGSYWNGEVQTEFASRGYHGTTAIQTEGRFWADFCDWMNENAISILKEELIRQGLKPAR